MEQSMVAHGGESPTRKANTRRHVAHATVSSKKRKMKNKIILILCMIASPAITFSQKADSLAFEKLKIEVESLTTAHEILVGQTEKIHDTADLLISWSGIVFTIFTLLLAFASIYTGMQITEIRKLKEDLKNIIVDSKKKLDDQNAEIQKIKERFEKEKETSLKLLFPLIEGQWNFYQGNYKRALELYKEVQKIEPNHPRILKQYFWLLTNTGNIAESIQKLEELVKLYPDDNDLKLRLSVAYRRNNQFEIAEQIVRDLAEKEQFAGAYYSYGSILLRKKEFERAEKAFIDANRFYNASSEASKYWIFMNLGITQIALSKSEDAKRNVQNAIALISEKIIKTPNNPHLYLSLGVSNLLLNKEDEDASKLIDEAIIKDLPIEHARSIVEKLNHIKDKLKSSKLNQILLTLDKYYSENKNK